jgi:uncharacterized membrane protein
MREAMLILHFLGLTMGLGTSFAHMFLSTATSNMTEEEATKFRLRTLVLTRMGHVGLALLLISGLYLITPYWKVLSSMPLLIVKLVLVVLLITLVSIISIAARKAQRSGSPEDIKKIAPIGKITFLIGIAIVIIAVCVFH